MTRIELSVLIDAPPAKVWASVSDLASHADWMRDAIELRFVGDATTGTGVVMECDTRIGPLTLTDLLVVTEWDVGQAIAIRHEGAVSGTGRFSIQSTEGGRTRFHWAEELCFPWWMGGPAGAALARPVLAWTWRRNLGALRSQIESGQRQQGRRPDRLPGDCPERRADSG